MPGNFKSAPAGSGKNDRNPVRLLPIGDIISRFGNSEGGVNLFVQKDQKFINGYFDVTKNSITGKVHSSFVKRPGTGSIVEQPNGTGQARGCYYWAGSGNFYSVIGTKIYYDNTDIGVTLSSSTGICGFAETHPAATTQYLCINDGIKLYRIDTSHTVTTVTVNFPTPNTGDLVYMDRYFFVLKTDGTLWHCELDDPATWNNTKFITAQMYSGHAVGMCRQNNLIYVLSDKHMQAFYNNANATGSVLNNYEQGVQQVGCASNRTIVSNEQFMIWVSNGPTGYSVFQLSGTTGFKEVASSGIQRSLQQVSSNPGFTAFSLRVAGKFLYVLNISDINCSLVYDESLDIWMEWTNTAGTGPFQYSSVTTQTFSPSVFAQHSTDFSLYVLNPTVGQDFGVSFPVTLQFALFDNDTSQRKFLRRIELIGDKQSSTTNVSLKYTDDDYITLSTARTFDMSLTRPSATRFGPFYRRGFQLTYTGANPLRIQGLDLYLSEGTD